MASKQLQRNMFDLRSTKLEYYYVCDLEKKKYKVGRYDVFIHMWSSSNTIHHLKILLTLRVQNILKPNFL